MLDTLRLQSPFVLLFFAKDACAHISVANIFTGGNSLWAHYHSIPLDSTRFNVNAVCMFAIHLLKALNQRKHAPFVLSSEQNVLWPQIQTHSTCAGGFIAQAFDIFGNIWKIQPPFTKGFCRFAYKGMFSALVWQLCCVCFLGSVAVEHIVMFWDLFIGRLKHTHTFKLRQLAYNDRVWTINK